MNADFGPRSPLLLRSIARLLVSTLLKSGHSLSNTIQHYPTLSFTAKLLIGFPCSACLPLRPTFVWLHGVFLMINRDAAGESENVFRMWTNKECMKEYIWKNVFRGMYFERSLYSIPFAMNHCQWLDVFVVRSPQERLAGGLNERLNEIGLLRFVRSLPEPNLLNWRLSNTRWVLPEYDEEIGNFLWYQRRRT